MSINRAITLEQVGSQFLRDGCIPDNDTLLAAGLDLLCQRSADRTASLRSLVLNHCLITTINVSVASFTSSLRDYYSIGPPARL
jgi:hypothetical protein